MRELIRCTNVCKDYARGAERVSVLRNVDLSVRDGTFTALMGPSGSGKTTLLNLIGGLDSPTSGEIEVDGLRLDSVNAGNLARWRARSVGFVFQFYNLLPVLNAQRNVELPLLLTGLSRSERRKNAGLALEIVGLGDRGKHKPGELSGGQQQRVAIARALVSDPCLLVCDEPTGDLDRATADEILTLLQTLHWELGKTIVMVTHDPRAADRAEHTLHMDKGRLVSSASGTAEAVA
ncbi:MAG: ABC transporter ATP-binding protein [Gammaproteobacteria bacterium]|nr:ABC transporter ATP-binding protein [Gammaproteobacteria bacterium]